MYGIAVAPPAVCLVMELCERSLGDLLADRPRFGRMRWREKLEMCIGCTRVRDACMGARCTEHVCVFARVCALVRSVLLLSLCKMF